MDVKITPSILKGNVRIPPSKSVAHRLIIAAGLADGESVISNIYMSKDIIATIEAMKDLGAEITSSKDESGLYTITVKGITKPVENAVIDCNESGSTLRFLIPVASVLGVNATFLGRGRLPQRPITPYLTEMTKNEVEFEYNNTMPFSVSGKLRAGEYKIAGDISSQFITGLLLALSVAEGESEIILTSHLESRPYVDITIDCLNKFGARIEEIQDGFTVKGVKALKPHNEAVEGDYSQAAFFCVANSLGCDINIEGLFDNSFQGDKKIIEICNEIVYNSDKNELKPFDIDCSDIPDLVPILAVLGSFCKGVSYIRNAARLRIKESDRLSAISNALNAVGGKVKELKDGLEITGVDYLTGGEIDSCNDHRIPMAMTVASVKCKGDLIIKGAECVRKSYPDFFEVIKSLGGIVETIG